MFELCIGFGCFVIFVVSVFLNVEIDVVDLLDKVFEVVVINVCDYGFEDCIGLYCGDLYVLLFVFCIDFDLCYDVILMNLLYVNVVLMVVLLFEYWYELEMVFVGGDDGMDIV